MLNGGVDHNDNRYSDALSVQIPAVDLFEEEYPDLEGASQMMMKVFENQDITEESFESTIEGVMKEHHISENYQKQAVLKSLQLFLTDIEQEARKHLKSRIELISANELTGETAKISYITDMQNSLKVLQEKVQTQELSDNIKNGTV